ncbi:hypothetical protein CH330_03605 [candidate division WOR-3 bacterium JGI_Cruoil_03_51_56]|uniref:Uncharacterized protein n=1 Tax=candidate division WOR-3 bacterium JGI_Cruoil_03_51_56 TaxID=1973747 RepID=A0A235BVA7_UNCW3|nr:MAG: hypothetical protein CH330_03605 [candidate division WOR-3 bacterium JGI_Cruoil_03_51_56]
MRQFLLKLDIKPVINRHPALTDISLFNCQLKTQQTSSYLIPKSRPTFDSGFRRVQKYPELVLSLR